MRGFSEYTLLIAKKDPGQGDRVVRIRLPHHRHRDHVLPAPAPDLDPRLTPAGELSLVARSDRYVDVEREFGRLLDDLVAVRRPA